jgi:acyl carrier protein
MPPRATGTTPNQENRKQVTRGEFLRALASELAVPADSLKEGQVLADIANWDSMAAVQFIALADEQLGADISSNQIAKAKTVGELLSLLADRLAD